MKIECLQKREGGSIHGMGGVNYHFKPVDPSNPDSPHVAEVANKDHVQRFLGISEGFRIYQSEGEQGLTPPPGDDDDQGGDSGGQGGEPVSDEVKAKLRSMATLDEVRGFAENAGVEVSIPNNMKVANAAEKVIEALEGNG